MIKSYGFTHEGETAALGERTRKGHERDGARDVAEGEGGGTFQNLGRARRQLPSAAGQTQVSLDQQLPQVASVFLLLLYFSRHREFWLCCDGNPLCNSRKTFRLRQLFFNKYLLRLLNRSKIRIRDGRAKPIDLLAKYISAEDDDLAVEMHEPYTFLNGLTVTDMDDLLEDIKVWFSSIVS